MLGDLFRYAKRAPPENRHRRARAKNAERNGISAAQSVREAAERERGNIRGYGRNAPEKRVRRGKSGGQFR